MNLQSLSDQQLMQYIDQIFIKYDRDRSGSLDVAQLGNFYADLYRCMGYSVQLTYQQASQAMAQIDKNFDGRASRQQLFHAFRYMLGQPSTYLTTMQPIPNYQYQPYVPQQPMYYQQGYVQQPMYGQQQPQMYGQQPQIYGQQPQIYGQGNYYPQQSQNMYGKNNGNQPPRYY